MDDDARSADSPLHNSNPGTPRSAEDVTLLSMGMPPMGHPSAAMSYGPPAPPSGLSMPMSSGLQGATSSSNTTVPVVPNRQPQSKYAQLLAIIEDLGKDIRPTYAGSKSSAERLKRGIVHARILVRECLMETERSARTWLYEDLSRVLVWWPNGLECLHDCLHINYSSTSRTRLISYYEIPVCWEFVLFKCSRKWKLFCIYSSYVLTNKLQYTPFQRNCTLSQNNSRNMIYNIKICMGTA